MPKAKTKDLKDQAIAEYMNIVSQWRFKSELKTPRELNRMGYGLVKNELMKLQVKRENIIQDQNDRLNANGQRNKIKRRSGLVFTRHVPPTSSGIMFYKQLLINQLPNQLYKIVVKKTDETTEIMPLSNFIKWIEGYEGEHAVGLGEVLDIQLFTLHLTGGCSDKGGKQYNYNINGWVFTGVTVGTKHNDCIFAVMQKFKDGKRKDGKIIRKALGYPEGEMISTDECQNIANYYGLNIILYYPVGEEIVVLNYKSTTETEKIASILLFNDHYYYVSKVITPEFQQIKTKFDSYITNIIKTDGSSYEQKYEEEFDSFDAIIDYIIQNPKRHIFIHGQGGTGKSVMSRRVEQWYKENNKTIIMTAHQGITAKAIGGNTLESNLKKYENKGFPCDLLIDEIGMVDGSQFDRIIKQLGQNRLIIVGDLKQLPPVGCQYHGYFFESMDYKIIHYNMTKIELTKIKRQSDEKFGSILSKIRTATFDSDVEEFFKDHQSTSKFPEIDSIVIASKNTVKDEYNDREIQKLIDQGVENKQYEQKSYWDMALLKEIYDNDESRMNAYMAKHITKMNKISTLNIYVGERVLLTQNLMKNGLANGSQGIVTGFKDDGVEVNFQPENIKIVIKPVIRYNKSVHELYTQKIPLMPAYALTIHKSQGMTIRTPLFINMDNLWNLELLYVGVSRVSDDKLLSLYNPPITHNSCLKFRQNKIVVDYLENGQFEQSGFKMVVDDWKKQMSIGKRPNTNLYKLNQIDLDFETSEYTNKHGLVQHRPYYNHMIHWKNGKKIDAVTIEDYKQKGSTPLVNGTNGNDVAQITFDYIMNAVSKYEKQIGISKKTDDKNLISETLKAFVRLISFNGAGFDLYFLLEKLLKTDGFTTEYQIRNIFKGNKLVQFVLYSNTHRCIVLQSFDIYQIVAPASLQKACQSYCKDQAEKLKFKNEIIYLAKNRYRNPECMDDQETRLTSTEIVTIKGSGKWKMDSLKIDDGWTIEQQDQQRLQILSEKDDSEGRRYKVNIFKIMNLRQSLDEYAKNDTEVLSILLGSLDTICHQKFDCSILNFLTAGSLCWYGFQHYAPKELFAEDIYDKNRHKKTRKHGERLKTHLYANEMDEEKFTLKSIIGGKSGPRIKQLPKYFDPTTHKRIRYVYLDISGMYCDLMLQYKYPFGKKQWINKTDTQTLIKSLQSNIPRYTGNKLKQLTNIKQQVLELHDKYFPNMFICNADFCENSISIEPMITYKKKIAGTDEKPIHKSMYTNERRNQIITSIDLITILLKGGELFGIDQCLTFERNSMILKKWMTECLEIKNEGKRLGLDAMTAFGKLLANGTYGQTLKQDKHEVIKFVDSEWDIDEFTKHYSLSNAFLTDSDTDILIGKELVNKEQYVTSRCSYIGSFVLAYSRLVIQDICQTLNPEQDPEKQPLYGDTDSLVCREDLVRERMIPVGYVQARSGLLADELADTCGQQFFYPPRTPKFHIKGVYEYESKDKDGNKIMKKYSKDDVEAQPDEDTWQMIIDPENYKFCTIEEGYFIQPKTIAILYYDLDGVSHTKIRAKGIPVNSCFGDDREAMSYKLFVDLLEKSKTDGGQQVILPEGLKVMTPNLIQGDMNQYGQELKANGHKIKKNNALFAVIGTNMTRKLFNTQYKGRSTNKDNNNIYVPYGHPLSNQINEKLILQEKVRTPEEQDEYDNWIQCQNDFDY